MRCSATVAQGLSPRARGSHRSVRRGNRSAYPRGPPTRSRCSRQTVGVYPRGRGEARHALAASCDSQRRVYPRGRGEAAIYRLTGMAVQMSNHHGDRVYPRGRGEALSPLATAHWSARVYPRGRGEAPGSGPPGRVRASGLSPRARGSPVGRVPMCLAWSYEGLSPRARGSPRIGATGRRTRIQGLSPRARGSPLRWRRVSSSLGGSIPAGAGKPVTGCRRDAHAERGVYPRGRGEARARPSPEDVRHRIRVYPRGRGEAIVRRAHLNTTGLSPRARGSHRHHVSHEGLSPRARGSPTCSNLLPPARLWRVYPRGRGEAAEIHARLRATR